MDYHNAGSHNLSKRTDESHKKHQVASGSTVEPRMSQIKSRDAGCSSDSLGVLQREAARLRFSVWDATTGSQFSCAVASCKLFSAFRRVPNNKHK